MDASRKSNIVFTAVKPNFFIRFRSSKVRRQGAKSHSIAGACTAQDLKSFVAVLCLSGGVCVPEMALIKKNSYYIPFDISILIRNIIQKHLH